MLTNAGHPSFRFLLIGFLGILLLELLGILWWNGGHLVYSLDDAYIHFALAENIMGGHYGVNSSEMSAPSSSILWPFIMAPLTIFPFTDWLVLLFNALLAAKTLHIIWQLIDGVLSNSDGDPAQVSPKRPILYGFVFFCLMAIGNLVGLVFTGMEHSLQVLLSCLVVAGLWQEASSKSVPAYLYAAVIILPLLRYESMALTAPALLYLFLMGYRQAAVLSGMLIAAVLIGFSGFLYMNDLGVLPSSILAKSGHAGEDAKTLMKLIGNALNNFKNPVGWLLFAAVMSLLPALGSSKHSIRQRSFAAVLFTAGWLHLLVGSLWWYGRYETYVLISVVVAALLLYRDGIQSLWRLPSTGPLIRRLCSPLLVLSIPSILILLTTPMMSGAIYRQPYQFHRLVDEYYPHPVALNDLGLVSFQNPHYVLDLWGLANIDALKSHHNTEDASWMHLLTKKHKVGLVFVTDAWFKKVPDDWTRVASFNRNDFLSQIPLLGSVSFYATDVTYVQEIESALRAFKATLPVPATLTLLTE